MKTRRAFYCRDSGHRAVASLSRRYNVLKQLTFHHGGKCARNREERME